MRPEARSRLAGTRSDIPPVSGSGVVVVVLGVSSSKASVAVVGVVAVGAVVVGGVYWVVCAGAGLDPVKSATSSS